MANFEAAFKKTMEHEGKYSDDPADLGGETYRGISRRFNPSWEGWKIVDRIKGESLDLTEEIQGKLDFLTREFYRINYWDKFLGVEISFQPVAEELFDTAVNMGIGRAVKFLQTALNCLNRNETLYDDLQEDGIFGFKTLDALDTLQGDELELLFKMLNTLQGAHYIAIMKSNPVQEKFCRGWFKRVTILKE